MLFPPRRAAGALVVVMLAGLPLYAQIPSARPTMAEVVSYALNANADVLTARLQVDSARGEQRIARGLPNPAFSVTPGTPFQFGVTQPIDIGPNRVYRMRSAGQGTTAVRLDAKNVSLQVVFSARQGFLDVLLTEAIRAVAAEQDTIMRRLLKTDSLRFREGDLAQRDLSTTELQFAHAQANLARADAAARAARINLQVLMGVSRPDTAFRVSGALEYHALELPLDSLRAIALTERPDIAAARERVAQSRSLRSLANSQLLPVPGLAVVYQPEPFGSGSNYALGVSVSIPAFYWFSGERERAAAGLQSAEVANRRTLTSADGEVVAAADNFRAARTLAERYASGLLDKARATVEMQRFAYEHGNASLLDVLNAISVFGDTQTDYYTAVHDYWMAAYTIDRAVGRDLVP